MPSGNQILLNVYIKTVFFEIESIRQPLMVKSGEIYRLHIIEIKSSQINYCLRYGCYNF